MKNLKLFVAFSFILLGSFAVSAQDFGVVNVEEVLSSFPEKTSADAQLDALVQKHQAEIKKQQDALLAIETEVQSKTEGKSQAEIQGMMTELEAKQKDYMTKQQALVTYQQAAAKELGEKENTLLKPIEDKVKASINKVAAAKGLKYVMEKSILLYSNGTDITADVKKDLGIK
ncbi:OmpH family outer membrane protein [Moheibacter lacus]|uniref:OmpH family outer membrane protein n=1 Tax=Moheibacter lacus TaxID=2745851 RepID=A0A838ZIX3_9FLAO|nr:OmpH family outer membrane protein [Moheibacter lacus]MBA5629208.1 OmpH family outer membrane protein [Moheibacter lacus]